MKKEELLNHVEVLFEHRIIDTPLRSKLIKRISRFNDTSDPKDKTTKVSGNVCVSCSKPIDNFDKDSNNCCDECWLKT